MKHILFIALIGLILISCKIESGNMLMVADNEEVQGRGAGKDQWWSALPRKEWSAFRQIEQSQPWFEVYTVFPEVYAIYEPGQFEEVISFLITGNDKALLFDTGLGIGNMRALAKELTELPIIVVNSHTHYDHIGSNYQFETNYTARSPYALANAMGKPHEAVAGSIADGWLWKPLPDDFEKGNYSIPAFTIARQLDDGDKIELGGRTMEVLLTPGHSPDSLCLLDRQNMLLFMGDTFYPASLYAHLGGSDFHEYHKTANRLATLADQVEYILPSHNIPVLKSHYLTMLKDAFNAVQKPDTPYALTDGAREYKFGDFSLIVSDPPPWK